MDNILKYERLVDKIASKYCYYSNFDDLKQVGMIGLLKALDKYIPNDNTKFSTYAVFWIKGEILEYLRRDKNIKISKEILYLSKEIEVCKDILRQRFSREPSLSEIAFFLEKSEEDITQAFYARDLVLSSDYCINMDDDGKEINLYDTIPYYETGYDEDILTLRTALEELSKEERELIEFRYFKDMTQSEVSKILGTNQVKICRSEAKILNKLKENMVA